LGTSSPARFSWIFSEGRYSNSIRGGNFETQLPVEVTKLRRTLFRVFLLAGALAYLGALLANVAADWMAASPTPENLILGLGWKLQNPSLWTQYARYCLYIPSGSESKKAVDAFLQAASLNPLDSANWDGLASAYLQTWETAKAESALRAWLVAVPSSPEAAWRLGQLLILQDRAKESFPYLKAAAAADRSLRVPLFDLAWKLIPDQEVILRDLIPSLPEALEDYLQFLIQTQRLEHAPEVWRQVLASHSRNALSVGILYLNALADARMGDAAADLWNQILASRGRSGAKPPGELITNGDFEFGLPDEGLDWRLERRPEYTVDVDDSVSQSGAHSLLVSFDNASNLPFAHVWQLIPVQPNHEYYFRGYIKTQNITSDSGPRFSITSLGEQPADHFEMVTENRIGTNPWTLEQLHFRTGPSTHFVRVNLRRNMSSKLGNLIQGQVWIDNVSLKATPD
jgi:tetratricopeptide (TPR) repeat protein